MSKVVFLILLLVGSLFAKEVDIAPFKKLKMFSDGRLTLERVYDHKSIYQIRFSADTKEGKREFGGYITKDKKMLIVGDGINLGDNKPIIMPLQMDKIKKNADIVYGTGKTELIVITDPECYYCQAFQQQWPELKKKYTFYAYLYPLSHHKQAADMSYYIMNQKTQALKAAALIKIAKDASADRMKMQKAQQSGDEITLAKKDYEKVSFSPKQTHTFNKKLENNFILSERLGVRGTPAVYDFKGGFVYWNKLAK